MMKKVWCAEIEEYEIHQHKSPISINDTGINKIKVSNNLLSGKQDFKYCTGCKDAKKIRPVCIFCPKISMYKRDFDKTKYVFFDKS